MLHFKEINKLLHEAVKLYIRFIRINEIDSLSPLKNIKICYKTVCFKSTILKIKSLSFIFEDRLYHFYFTFSKRYNLAPENASLGIRFPSRIIVLLFTSITEM